MKNLVFVIFILSTSNLAISNIHAQSPTESIRDSVKKQVDEELSQIKKAVAKKGFVGSISAKSDGTLTITNLQGSSRQAAVTADATIKLQNGKDGTPADLKVGDFVISMGDVDSANFMTVKRLLVIAKPTDDKRVTIFGTVTKATTSTLTIETLDKKAYSVKVQASTKYTGKTKTTDVKVDGKVIILGTTTSDTALTAKIVHLFAN